MIAPPRMIETLLEALGAEAQFRDGVLGDLAEEYASRVERDGASSARRWYRHEALRVAPHLLWNWLRRLRGRGVANLVGVIVTSYVALLSLGIVFGSIVYAVLTLLGAPTEYHLPWANPLAASLLFGASLALGILVTMLGGYFAARLGNDAALASAIAFGVVWSLADGLGMLFMHSFPMWYRASVPVDILVGAVLGGLIRVKATAGAMPPPRPPADLSAIG